MADDLEKTVAQFIRLHGIFAGDGGILAAVSGGADSIALLLILKSLRNEGLLHAELLCAHINHRLRGQAGDADERFVVEQAGRLGVRAVTRAVDVRAYAGTQKLSIETAARHLRLAALAEMAREHRCTWIATGHQQNDNAETIIHRLQRGTGFRGLAGIRPVRELDRNLHLGRPLLAVARDEIVRYLQERHLSWREDHTNADIAYTRNRIRHRLLPLLQQESEAPLVEELVELAGSAGRLYDRIRQDAEQAWARIAETDVNAVRIDATGMALLPEMVAIELIRRALVGLGSGERELSERHYDGILRLARRREVGKGVSLPGGFSARYEFGQVVLRRAGRPESALGVHALIIPGATEFDGYKVETQILEREGIDGAGIAGDKGPFIEYLDWDRVTAPVIVRPRRAGDRFEPLGLGAVKKVGKFLTAARVPRDVRQQTMVFADRQKIIWLCPVRLAESVKITENTRRILVLSVNRT